MRLSFLTQKRGIFLVLVIALASLVITFYGINVPDSEVSVSTPDGTPLNDITPTPIVAPFASRSISISPLSPLSPVSPVPSSILLDPEMLQQLIDDGLQLYENGDYDAAIEIFDDILAQPSDAITFNARSITHNARGSAYLALGNYEQALNDYRDAIELDATIPHAFYNRGRVLIFLKKYDEALEDLQKSIDLSPIDFGYRGNGNIGLIYHKMGEYDKALEAFEKSISYNKDERADAYYLRGETYTALENYDAAIADYQAAIERFTQYTEAYQSLGYAYYKTGQFDQALESLDQALEITPDSPIAHLYLALVYLATDQPDEALSAASQGVNAMDTVSEDDQEAIFSRILTDLETIAQEQPDSAETVEAITDLIPAQ